MVKIHQDDIWEQKKQKDFDGDYYFDGKRYRFLFAAADSDFVMLIEVPDVSR